MPNYLLDTNAFWEVIISWKNGILSANLPNDLIQNQVYTFSISEITAMEIYSVLGKKLRGKQKQVNLCSRTLSDGTTCSNKWEQAAERKFSPHEGQAILHIIRAILLQKQVGFLVNIIPIDRTIISLAATLLELYANKYDFRSLDSIVAATSQAGGFATVTYDTKLKNVLKMAQIAVYESHISK